MIVTMKHKKSSLTISVLESQVKNAEYHGWKVVANSETTKLTKPKEVKKDGESNRK